MSKNFELLHEAGRVQEMFRQRMEQAVPGAVDEFVPGPPVLPVDGMAGDEVEKLVQRLFLLPGPRAPRQVVFAATEQGNGCSWICSRVADILASQVRGSVCMVDGNPRSPSLHQEFGVSNHAGLAEALEGSEPIRQFAQQLARPNLWLLSCGSVTEKSEQFLTMDRMRRRMSELREEFDYILLDAAPFDSCDHALRLGNWCDGVVLVLKANSSPRKTARKVVEELQRTRIPVLGAVLNQRTFPIPHSVYSRL
jgi:polysaccharide biosynthesis transport protein